MRWRLGTFTVAILLAGSGCDSGPEGPGTLTVSARGPALGAVLLEIDAAGVQGFSALGSTRLYAGEVPDRSGLYRVILITPDAGALAFDMRVQDLGKDRPVVRVISAAADDNASMRPGDVTVRVGG
ncbi:MAG: hypothetical protein R3304_11805 [Longimicrobiales bacterium]|nr:hypothetical protein [Longimicrobiales bacterium]